MASKEDQGSANASLRASSNGRNEAAPSASFTPGPWSYTLGDVMRVTTRDNNAVCGVHRIGRHSGGGDPEVWAANARLIASAPDLYEALKLAEAGLDFFIRHAEPRLPASGNAVNHDALARIRAALAKAGA